MGIPNKKQDDAISIFIEECNEILERVTLNALKIEKGNSDYTLLQEVYRDIHTLKGTAALYGFQTLSRLAHALESRLDLSRKKFTILNSADIDLILQCLDVISQILNSILSHTSISPELELTVTQLEQKLNPQ